MLNHIGTLREISECCRTGRKFDAGHVRWLGSALQKFLSHECISLDEALGLKFPRGGVPWWMEEAMRERDAALRQLVRRFCPDKSVRAQAQYIVSRSRRYAASAWRFDREKKDMPREYLGTQKACLWRAFKSGASMPISERRLRDLLAA